MVTSGAAGSSATAVHAPRRPEAADAGGRCRPSTPRSSPLEPRPRRALGVAVDFDGSEFTGRLHYVGERLTDERGEVFGYVMLYGPSLPASVLGLLTRGDASTFARMAALAEPGRRQAAVLFAALEDSGALSRRLPSAVYFDLVRELVTAIDDAVVARPA